MRTHQMSVHKIEKALAAMEAVLEREDDEALLDFRCRCWELTLLVRDARRQAHIDALVQHAKQLYCERSAEKAGALRAKLRALLADFRLATARVAA